MQKNTEQIGADLSCTGRIYPEATTYLAHTHEPPHDMQKNTERIGADLSCAGRIYPVATTYLAHTHEPPHDMQKNTEQIGADLSCAGRIYPVATTYLAHTHEPPHECGTMQISLPSSTHQARVRVKKEQEMHDVRTHGHVRVFRQVLWCPPDKSGLRTINRHLSVLCSFARTGMSFFLI